MVYKSLLLLAAGALLLSSTIATGRKHQPTSLHFIENKGQITDQQQQPRPDIDFRIGGSGVHLFIGNAALHYQWAKPVSVITAEQEIPKEFTLYRMDVQLLGATPNAEVLAEQKQGYHERYYTPVSGSAGTVAYSYQKITYKEVYPNIDWVLYIKDMAVEYDFVVHPGGKLSDIRLQYKGATHLSINSDGSLTATTPMGKVTEAAPVALQQADKKSVPASFVVDNNVLSFATGSYEGTLIIDPVLEWGTYYGGLYSDNPAAIVADDGSHTYLAGITSSIANIATVGAHQTTYGGPASNFILGDAFLAKFSIAGELLWATYYGGSDEDRASDLALDQNTNKLYLAGSTRSTTAIATTGAHQENIGGAWDAFLVQFDTAGVRQWATYYGGSNDEGSQFYSIGVATDNNGAVLLSGDAVSTDNIASVGAQQSQRNGSIDGFLVKFDSTGTRQWGTYFGGNNEDYAKRVTTDGSNNIYLSGYTNSSSGLSTVGAYQPDNSGEFDAFLAKYNTSGELQWATYFGASAHDEGHAVRADNLGNVFIAGLTLSPTGISTADAHQVNFGDGFIDGFLIKFSSAGEVEWASYYGGNGVDLISSIVPSNSGEVFICGTTTSDTGIASPGALIGNLNNQSYDAFFAKFSGDGTRQWDSYYGGTEGESNCYLAVNNIAEVFLTGSTISATGISTPDSYQPFYDGGADDVFLIKLNVCEQPPAPLTLSGDTLICEGQSYTYITDSAAGAIAYEWVLPSGWSGSSDSTSIVVIPDANSGTVSVVALNNCAVSDTISLDVTVNPAPLPVIQQQDNILSTTESYSTYQWIQDGADITGATAATYTVTDTGMYAVRVSNAEGCSGTSEAVAAGGTGIAGLAGIAKAISVYPNPAGHYLYIKSPIPVTVVVSGIEGKRLLVADRVTAVDMRQLAPGMYLLQVYDSKGRLLKTEKVVKNGSW